jgi:hypothetical protein
VTEAPQPPTPLDQRRWAPWLFLLGVAVLLAVAMLVGWMSPVAGLDIVSLWPLLVPVLILAVIVSIRKKAVGTVPLYLASFMLFAAGVHYSEWQALPSASADITREIEGSATEGAVEADIDDGALVVSDDSGSALYTVRPLRAGGRLGPPAVVESGIDGRLQLVLVERPANAWFRFSGWVVRLSRSTRWDLSLRAADLELDLSGLQIGRATLGGAGSIALPSGAGGELVLDGEFRLTVAPGAVVQVVGVAVVPAGWSATEDGYRSPGAGPGWLVAVEPGSAVRITTG